MTRIRKSEVQEGSGSLIALAIVAGLAATAFWPGWARGQATQPAGDPGAAATTQPAPEQPAPKKEAKKRNTTKAWGARVEPDPPGYVKTLDKLGLPGTEELDWLEFGLEHRTRWEYRDDDYRQAKLKNDDQFLLRSRGYVGIKEALDPFRLGFEFQDARQFGSNYPETNRDVDEADILQAFGELYFKDALGAGQPLSLRAGRMSFEVVDRRLVGRNRWRNTVNAFDGFRLRAGDTQSDWALDLFAVQPVERRMVKFDPADEERWFYGLVGAWRKWEQYATLEPYYFILDEDRKGRSTTDREIHTLGLHVFGPIGKSGFDYDLDNAFQFGSDGDRDQCTFASYSEVGYTFDHAWKPRPSFAFTYATGDRNPNDSRTERFDRLFQVGHPYSMHDLFVWQNVINPKARIDFRPTDKLRVNAAYGAYWLASDSDTWLPTTRRDRTGTSGDYVGQEIELQARYQIDPRIELELGYSHFIPGSFPGNTGDADDADFFYVQTTFQLYK